MGIEIYVLPTQRHEFPAPEPGVQHDHGGSLGAVRSFTDPALLLLGNRFTDFLFSFLWHFYAICGIKIHYSIINSKPENLAGYIFQIYQCLPRERLPCRFGGACGKPDDYALYLRGFYLAYR